MKRILISLAVIGVLATGIALGTNALFTSEATSTGNTFSTGGVALRIDNVSHYNGMTCAEIGFGTAVYQWVPAGEWAYDPASHPVAADFTPAEAAAWNTAHPVGYPLAGDVCTGTWPLKNLVAEKLFSFLDVKPGDRGEDTVSLHIEDNDVYGCLDVTNVQDIDLNQTQPEALVDADGMASGELAENMYFFAWKDDGDNVYEANEVALTSSPVKGSDLTAGIWPLADSTINGGAPLASGVTHFVGVAWCAGEMTVVGNTISCSNQTMGNEAQTDLFSADLKVTVVQARNNESFVCGEEPTPSGTPTGTPTPTPGHIIVDKITVPAQDPQSFDFTTVGIGYNNFSLTDAATPNDQVLAAGTYSVSETLPLPANWVQTSAVCVSSLGETEIETIANLELDEGETITCTFTNTYTAPCLDQGDVMLVLDRSGSISTSEMNQLKTAALAFVTALAPDGGVHMGQTSFQTTGALNTQLTGIIATINAGITALTTSSGFTNLFDGISLASTELASVRDRLSAPNYMIVITDGNPNRPTNETTARTQATNAANAADAAGTKIFVLGVGSDVDATYLTNNIATDAAHYFPVSNYAGLTAALNAIATCSAN